MVAGPVRAEVRLVSSEGAGTSVRHAVTSLRVTEDEQVFAGHYPGFPIFPGVCVIECVHRSAMATVGRSELVLRGVETARFLGAVLPGDDLKVALEWDRTDDTWRCFARVHTSRGEAAVVRLRYTKEEAS